MTPGYSFHGWSGCDAVGGYNQCTVVMGANRTVTASFSGSGPTPPASSTLSVEKSGAGTITSSPAGIDCGSSCSAALPDGTGVSLVAKPDRGYRFAGWSGCPAPSGDRCTLTLGSDTKVAASFRPLDPPDTWIGKARINSRSSTATFTFGGNEGTGGLRYSCQIDGRPAGPCSGSASYRLTRGRHTFRVVAADELGRADPTPATRSFKLKRRASR